MATVKVVETVNAPADKVWELVRDFGGVDKISAQIESCTVEGSGVGAVRTLAMPGGLSLRERLEAFDEPARSLSYAIIGSHPLPLDDYLSKVKVVPAGNTCTVEWSSSYEPKGDEAQVAKLVEGIYRGGIAGIRKTLGV